MRALAILVGFALSGMVYAGPTEPIVDPEGYVRVEMDLHQSPDAVLAYLSDAGRTMRLGEEITSVETTKDGDCTRMRVTTRRFAQTMQFLARRCRTADGWRSTMLESPDFKTHDIEWTVTPAEVGSRVTMRVRIIPRIPVPQLIIRKIVGGALTSTMMRLESLLD